MGQFLNDRRESVHRIIVIVLLTVIFTTIPMDSMKVYATQDEIMKASQTKPHQIISKSFFRDGKSDDGTVILKCSLNYPQVKPQEEDPNLANITKVNGEIKTQAIKVFSQKCNDAMDYTHEFLGQIHQGMMNRAWLPFVIDISYELTFNRNDLLSFTSTEFEWLGGAHPSTELRGAIYDLKQGKSIRPEDLLVLDEVGIKKFIADEVMKLYKKNPENYFPEEVKGLQNYDFEYGTYLNDDGFVFFLQPYIVAPYVTGVVSVYLRYQDYPELFRVEEAFRN